MMQMLDPDNRTPHTPRRMAISEKAFPCHDITWWRHQRQHFSRYWPFVRGIHRSPSRHHTHYDGTLMSMRYISWWLKNSIIHIFINKYSNYLTIDRAVVLAKQKVCTYADHREKAQAVNLSINIKRTRKCISVRHRGLVIHIGVRPCQASIWNDVGLLLIRPLGTSISEILMKENNFQENEFKRL